MAGLGLVVIAIVMTLAKIELGEVQPACTYATKILCLELAVSGEQLNQVIHGPTSVALWRFHLGIDFPYLVFYATVFAGAFFRAGRGGRLAASLIIVAALLDAVENITLLLAVGGEVTDAHALWARTAAHGKFLLLAISVSFGMILLGRESRQLPAKLAFWLCGLLCAVGWVGPESAVALEVGGAGLALASVVLTLRAISRLRQTG